MPALSRIDHSTSPPTVELPRDYNAAYDLVQRHVDQGRGDRVAVIDDDGRHSYAAVAERALRAATALAGLGVKAEQRVAMVMLDSVDFVATFLGAIALGAVPVPLNTLLTADDYGYLVRDMRATVLIGSVLSGTGTAPSAIAPRNVATKSTESSMHIATRCSAVTPRPASAEAARIARSATAR